MPEAKTIHFNAPGVSGKTRCGLPFHSGRLWREQIDEVTCDNCLRGIERDKRDAERREAVWDERMEMGRE